MRKLIAVMLVLMGMSPVAWAQTKTISTGNIALNAMSPQNTSNSSSTHTFNIQLRKAINGIRKDIKSGKLSKSQAVATREKVKAIRIQEMQFFKENGNKQLTADQLTQLNNSLTAITSTL